MQPDLIRYAIQLEMLERSSDLSDRDAIELLLSEFALAHNAGRFDALSGDAIELDVLSRSSPQEGVARFTIALLLSERRPELHDAAVARLLERSFDAALNASYFLRICTDDNVTLRLLSRERAGAEVQLDRAA
jgi:hypothetical protein